MTSTTPKTTAQLTAEYINSSIEALNAADAEYRTARDAFERAQGTLTASASALRLMLEFVIEPTETQVMWAQALLARTENRISGVI